MRIKHLARSGRTRFPIALLSTMAIPAAALVFGVGTAAGATSIDCNADHYAFGPAPATIAPGTYSITGVCYGPFLINSGGVVTLQGQAREPHSTASTTDRSRRWTSTAP